MPSLTHSWFGSLLTGRPTFCVSWSNVSKTTGSSTLSGSIDQYPVSWNGRSMKLPSVEPCSSRLGRTWRAPFISFLPLFELIGSPCQYTVSLRNCPTCGKGLIKGVFQTKASSPWAGNRSERLCPCACPTTEISTHGLTPSMPCPLLGQISRILVQSTSSR